MNNNTKNNENKMKYNSEYNKKHYRNIALRYNSDFYNQIEQFCIAHEISKQELIKRALTAYMDTHDYD